MDLPPPRPIAETEAADALLLLSRSGTGAADNSWHFRAPEVLLGHSMPSAPVGLTRSITGFHYQSSEGTGTLPASPIREAIPEEITLNSDQTTTVRTSLEAYLEILRERQDKVYDGPTRSHDEMAAQDMEFEELDRKIAEIDGILEVLNANE